MTDNNKYDLEKARITALMLKIRYYYRNVSKNTNYKLLLIRDKDFFS